jgi:excisionase family DNA binding protein
VRRVAGAGKRVPQVCPGCQVSTDHLLQRIEALEARALKGGKRLLSKREAARRLGISRNTTLEILIRRGQLRLVTVGKVKRIPAADVERLVA